MIEHHIQKEILLRLSKAPSLRFSELKPEELESNAFMYHLKQLQAQKLVDKTEAGYQLSDDGLAYIDGFSFNTLKLRKQPKVISILAVRNTAGQWLLAKRKYQPYINQYMLPSGKQHLGEAPAQHADRELKEKLHINVPLKRRGLSDIRIYRGDKLITHVLAHIYEGVVDDASLPPETHQFSFDWIKKDDKDYKLLAGTTQIMNSLESEAGLFFLSLDVQDD
jgi:ADP-ribose pyrophosphatase YjhB (NUDIX family)